MDKDTSEAENSDDSSLKAEPKKEAENETETDNEDMENEDVENENAKSEDVKSKENEKSETKKPKLQLSARMEYLARPKKDILDKLVYYRLDGALPDDSPPVWELIPLPTKIPFDQCPIAVTRTKMATNLFLPPPASTFDLEDENNLVLPYKRYDNMNDPNLKGYVRNKYIYEHLLKEGYITDSEKVTCTLSDINKYRRYQRRILAADAHKKLRDQDQEFRRGRAENTDMKSKRDMQRYHERRTQGAMRRWIKSTVASIKESSMMNQMVRDMKALNSQIRRQKVQRDRVEATKERYHRLYAQHVAKKYENDKDKRKTHLSLAKKDAELLEKLCERKEEKKQKNKDKLEDFWKRKSGWQKEWIDLGVELEKIREEEIQTNIEILKRKKTQPVARNIKERQDSGQRRASPKTETLEKKKKNVKEKVQLPKDVKTEKLPLQDTTMKQRAEDKNVPALNQKQESLPSSSEQQEDKRYMLPSKDARKQQQEDTTESKKARERQEPLPEKKPVEQETAKDGLADKKPKEVPQKDRTISETTKESEKPLAEKNLPEEETEIFFSGGEETIQLPQEDTATLEAEKETEKSSPEEKPSEEEAEIFFSGGEETMQLPQEDTATLEAEKETEKSSPEEKPSEEEAEILFSGGEETMQLPQEDTVTLEAEKETEKPSPEEKPSEQEAEIFFSGGKETMQLSQEDTATLEAEKETEKPSSEEEPSEQEKEIFFSAGEETMQLPQEDTATLETEKETEKPPEEEPSEQETGKDVPIGKEDGTKPDEPDDTEDGSKS